VPPTNSLTLAFSPRVRGPTGVFGRDTPTWDTEVNFGEEAVGAAYKFPHSGLLPEGEGTDRGVWERYADVGYRGEFW
jgi:hypothetical protein